MKLLDYIRGLRKGKEANRLEKESMKDPFLADAMDGYQQVEGDHEREIEKLRRRILAHSTKKRTYAIAWSVAACLVIGFGISTYFLFLKKNITDDVFIAQESVLTTETDSTARQQETATATLADSSRDSARVTPPSVPSKKPDRKSALAQAKPEQTKSARVVAEELEVIEPISPSPAINQKVAADEKVAIILEDTQKQVEIASSEQSKDRSLQAMAKDNKIRGVVKDPYGEPLIGATVNYSGTNIGTVTGVNGEFTLDKQEGKQKLTARYIGYDTVEMPVDSNRDMLFAMKESDMALSEVVVTGYGKISKKSITGSIAKAHPKEADRPKDPQPLIGMRKYQKYLKEKLVRPTDECRDIKGEVTLSFSIGPDGTPTHITVVKSLCDSADQEAIRLLREGPKWNTSSLQAEIKVKF